MKNIAPSKSRKRRVLKKLFLSLIADTRITKSLQNKSKIPKNENNRKSRRGLESHLLQRN
jgi:hypothetical protein